MSIAAIGTALLLMLSLSGCRQSDGGTTTGSREQSYLQPAVHLTGEGAAASPLMGKPTALGLAGSDLWVGDFAGDPYLHVFDVRTGALQRSFGRSGEGPGDLLSLVTMIGRPSDSTGVWVHDMSLRRLTRFDGDPTVPPEVISFERAAMAFTWVGRDLLAGADGWDTVRVILFDTAGHVVQTLPGPMLRADSIPAIARHDATVRVALCASPDGAIIAALHQRASRIELFSVDGGFLGLADTPVDVEPVFRRSATTGSWHSEGQPMQYRSCAATQRYLYGLFDNRPIDSNGMQVDTIPLQVHAFHWDGRFSHGFVIDRNAGKILVSGDTLLMTATWTPDTIIRYRLPRNR